MSLYRDAIRLGLIEAPKERGLWHLHDYVMNQNNARVPVRYISPDGFRLGGWVSRRRQDYRKGKLSPERVKKLERFPGWTWSVR